MSFRLATYTSCSAFSRTIAAPRASISRAMTSFSVALAQTGFDTRRTVELLHLVFALAQSGSETLGVLLFVMELSLKL